MSAPARFADAQDTDDPGRRRSSPNGSAFRPALSRSRSSICFRWSWPISGDSFRGGGAEKHLGWKVGNRGPEFERNARADTRGAGAAPVAVLEGRQGRAALHDERRGHRRGQVTGTRRARPASRVETALGKKRGVRALSERLRARRAAGAVVGRSEATRAGGASRRGRPAGRACFIGLALVRLLRRQRRAEVKELFPPTSHASSLLNWLKGKTARRDQWSVPRGNLDREVARHLACPAASNNQDG